MKTLWYHLLLASLIVIWGNSEHCLIGKGRIQWSTACLFSLIFLHLRVVAPKCPSLYINFISPQITSNWGAAAQYLKGVRLGVFHFSGQIRKDLDVCLSADESLAHLSHQHFSFTFTADNVGTHCRSQLVLARGTWKCCFQKFPPFMFFSRKLYDITYDMFCTPILLFWF
jgi:hypothetical protein